MSKENEPLISLFTICFVPWATQHLKFQPPKLFCHHGKGSTVFSTTSNPLASPGQDSGEAGKS